jgi:uncharacterized protein (TIRG00374 family)
MNPLKSWRLWLGCTISLLCLWLAFRKVPLGELFHAAAGANLLLLLAAFILQFLAVLSRAPRWLVLLDKESGLANSFWAQSVGFLFTNVFPLRLGEPARVLVMSDRCHLPVMQVTASAIVERLLDVAANVVILILVLPWMQVPTLMKRAGMVSGILVLTGLGILALVVRFGRQSERLLRSVCSHLPWLPVEKVTARWRELVVGFLPWTRWRTALRASAWSLVTWVLSLSVVWSVLHAFRPDARLVEGAFMMVAVAFALAVPSSPGFVGVYQLVGQQALVLPFGAKYDAAGALAITLTVHLVYYLVTTGLGVLGLWQLGESFVNIGRILLAPRPTGKPQSGNVAPQV